MTETIFNNYEKNSKLTRIIEKGFFANKIHYGLKIDGIEVLSNEYDAICILEDDETRRFVKNGKAGIFNRNFEIVFDSDYKWISSKELDGSRRFVDKKGNCGIMNKDYKVIYPPKSRLLWIGKKELDGNRIVVFAKRPLYIRDFIPMSMMSFAIFHQNRVTKKGNNISFKKFKESKEYLFKVNQGEIVPYFNLWDQCEGLEENEQDFYDTLCEMVLKTEEKLFYGLINDHFDEKLEHKYCLISKISDNNQRVCTLKKKNYIYDTTSGTIKEQNN